MDALINARLIFVFAVVVVAGCVAPKAYNVHNLDDASYSMPAKGTALISNVIDEQPSPELSGFYPLIDGLDAFAARIALIETAQYSVDLQYYLYHREETSQLLSAYLLRAAERGVRVRLLLDDLSQANLEQDLSALAVHNNVEVRLFNPLNHRRLRFLSFITDYSRVSRRMHNKSFIVDSELFITGGRNIGNAYFSGDHNSQFVDFDVLGVGPIVDKATMAFDLYWNHPLAEDINELSGSADSQDLAQLSSRLSRYVSTAFHNESPYIQRLKESTLVQTLVNGKLSMDWAEAQLYVDDPNKLLTDSRNNSTHMAPKLFAAMGEPRQRVNIISPYFIPKDKGLELIKKWREQGVAVTVLTNSLAATDVPVVHAGYADYRQQLLAMGVELWELKRNLDLAAQQPKRKGFRGSSTASLHAKSMTMDDDKIFVGSLNLDPRSFNLNTEQGLLIHSERMNRLLSRWITTEMPKYAWQLSLDEQGDIVWQDRKNQQRLTTEPDTSAWLRFKVWLMSLLPIEDVL
ncbi:phospholipase D family protein [Pseudoalteromonas ruthenica]|uniref:PLD phosphodiesterase domain-containing protein n=1 Tax=Pseudoalteromonas ruthenica TaxID=151081 RepID=A0A0F4PSR7_9GAMM|nr:phospholipase D family protein [Pseudoalteromonas ruthenica]KJY98179.1 hypothetical protein TW76_06605 [Pseudoalteromonas ruthenica]KJZ02246.1 hypothetical protein TW72_00815 [Pseudoalteromonas ruthenica]TMO90211.1 phospholipase D family protein [Pseudoalteromonas ruthenica]TMO92084.1 phospholipase D family protein [Pseudoalteromonas ruthenica]TMO99532.1 phospholipase D family protein [Pseudoalteromonas ruthenica]